MYSMDNTLYLTTLYDYYGSLLTKRQQQYFEDYYFQNLTLQEISDNYQISRNAIHKTIKEVENKLKFYEQKLKLYQKQLQLEPLLQSLEPKIQAKIREII